MAKRKRVLPDFSVPGFKGLVWVFWIMASVFSFSCQSSPKNPPAEADVLIPAKIDSPSYEASISSSKVPDGSILFLSIRPKAGKDLERVKVRFEDAEYPLFEISKNPREIGALIAIPFNSKPRLSRIEIVPEKGKGAVPVSIPVEVIDGNYLSEKLQVDEKKVTPPKKVIRRILREQKEIGALYQQITPIRYWSGSFTLPLDSELTSPFGNKRIYNGHMNGFHQGLDLRARTPLPIKAPEKGRVAMAKDLYFTGNTVILDHGFGLFTIYAHMSRLDVKSGALVHKGHVLGLTGATGRASGPHLHWGAVLMKLKFNPLDLTKIPSVAQTPQRP